MDDGGLGQLVEDLAPLARRFADAGHRLYLVGGVVRDTMLGRFSPDDDVDLTTDAEPAAIRRLVAPLATALWTQGERFGTIGARIGHRPLEITTHRAETYAEDSRKPTVAFGTDIEVDLSRRDFTINAMARTLPGADLIDPFGGARDLSDRRLRTPLDPRVSFSDDPLRMLRAARFVARFSLQPDDDLVAALAAMSPRLSIVSVERIHDELERLLALPDPGGGLELLTRTSLLGRVLPEVIDVGDVLDPRFGGRPRLDVALTAASAAPATPLLRRVLLMWPVACEAGAAAAGRTVRRLRYSREDVGRTERLLQALVEVVDDEGAADAVVRHGASATGPDLPLLWSAVAALRDQSDDERFASHLDRILSEGERWTADELGRLAPPLDGRAVMDHLGCGPGPVVGQALAVLRRHIVDHGPLEADQAREVLDRWWAEQRES